MNILLPIFLIIICCLVIWKASDGFETASEYLGRNLSDGVKGATINAIGSSIPELFTTIFFLLILHDQEGFSGGIGTTAGSALFNAMVIPAAVILAVIFAGKVTFIKVSKKVILRDGIMLLLCEFVLIFLLSEQSLHWWHGLLLMLMYGVYMVVMFTTMKKEVSNKIDTVENTNIKNIDNVDEITKNNLLKNLLSLNLEALVINRNKTTTKNAWLLLLTSTFFVGGSSAFLVLACEKLGAALEIPIYFVAVILASAATSVPDTILSIKDARKGNYDDAVSNALGSNIFDICFALGLPLFIYTLIFNPIEINGSIAVSINELRIILLILTTIVFFIFLFSKKIKALQAYLLLIVYSSFVAYILGKSLNANWTNELGILFQWFSS